MIRAAAVVHAVAERWHYRVARLRRRGSPPAKVFCVGRNKTGTTSMASFFRANGFRVGDQARAEDLLDDWARRDFSRIIDYCRHSEAFQDVPFSLPETYRALDAAFPDGRFILTVRSSAEEWYASYVAFHAMLTGSASIPPTAEDLERFVYRNRKPGLLLKGQKLVYGYPQVPLYDKRTYIASYEAHNAGVRNYFSHAPEKLLVLNLSDTDAFERLCCFVGLDPVRSRRIPHLNRSAGYSSKDQRPPRIADR